MCKSFPLWVAKTQEFLEALRLRRHDARRVITFGAASNERGTLVSHAHEEKFLTCLWELADGTEARVVEHPSAPRWELCVVRRGQIVQRQRCVTISELIARSTAFYASTTGMN